MPNEDEYLTLSAAARRWRISDNKHRRHVNRGDLIVYQNNADLRSRLLRRAEVEAFLRPAPAAPRRAREVATA